MVEETPFEGAFSPGDLIRLSMPGSGDRVLLVTGFDGPTMQVQNVDSGLVENISGLVLLELYREAEERGLRGDEITRWIEEKMS